MPEEGAFAFVAELVAVFAAELTATGAASEGAGLAVEVEGVEVGLDAEVEDEEVMVEGEGLTLAKRHPSLETLTNLS